MKNLIAPALLAMLVSAPALAQSKLSWVSAPIFVGQTTGPDGTAELTYLASIQSTGPDANGQYELFVDTKPFYQESFADVFAIKKRAECNATGDNSCVLGKPGFIEILQTWTVVTDAKH